MILGTFLALVLIGALGLKLGLSQKQASYDAHAVQVVSALSTYY